MRIGNRTKIECGSQMAECYLTLAKSNESSANCLLGTKMYNEAAYYYIQAMEKRIKEQICRIINVENPYYANKLRDIGHSFDDSVSFLVEIKSGNNDALREQIKMQLVTGVLKDIKFSKLHNDLRYPYYNYYKKEYTLLILDEKDCKEIGHIHKNLVSYLSQLHRI